MRLWLITPVVAVLAFPASASAQAQAPDDPAAIAAPSGGQLAGTLKATPRRARPAPLRATAFSVTPRAVVPGSSPAVVAMRVDGGTGRVSVRVDLVAASGGRPVARLRVGRRHTGRVVTRRWAIDVPAGSYVARLHAVDAAGAPLHRDTGAPGRFAVTVRAPRSSTPAATAPRAGGRFPVAGPFSFGTAANRFGAGRTGHIHQGQDVAAAEGTPVVSPVAGSVYWRAVQAAGAGNYLVVRGDDGPDYVFMHLVAGSERVAKGDRVGVGQQLGRVGHTGDAQGSHLHFEIWPDGWYAKGSHPIDPLAQLRAWAGA